MTDEEVIKALIALVSETGWRRLEIGRTAAGGYAGYSVEQSGRTHWAHKAIGTATCPPTIQRLADLLNSSQWQRLEAVRRGPARINGYCVPCNDRGIWFDARSEDGPVTLSSLPRWRPYSNG